MSICHVQALQERLDRRIARLSSLGFKSFHKGLKQFVKFLDESPVLSSVLEELRHRYPGVEERAGRAVSKGHSVMGESDDEHAALAYAVFRECVLSSTPNVEVNVGTPHMSDHTAGADVSLEAFRAVFLEPLHGYLEEQLDGGRLMLSHLRRYKHRCEWFRCEQLFETWTEDQQRGEKLLAADLYEYLYDQGVEFSIEPESISGRPDFVTAQSGDDPLVADVKIFNPGKSKGKAYIVNGFRQVYDYTLSFNQVFGYVVIFNTSPVDLRFSMQRQEQQTPFVVHNHKTIFFVTVDIYPHDEPASKRGKLRTVEIAEEELVEKLTHGDD
jgi:hypothetical protein